VPDARRALRSNSGDQHDVRGQSHSGAARRGSDPLVHLGSAAEYGVQPEGVPITESAKPEPVSNYGRSKLAATRKIIAATNDGDIAATVLRVFNPIGLRAPADSSLGAPLIS